MPEEKTTTPLPSGGYPIAIMGESGQGKSTSLRQLDPESTIIIDADRKGLPWRHWRKDWSENAKNYIGTNDVRSIISWIQYANKTPHIKVVVIDTVSAVMVDSEMRRANEKGFEKWTELAKSVYDLIGAGLSVRSDLHVVFIFHSETSRSLDGGDTWTQILTSGKKLKTIGIESKFPIVLLAKSRRDDKRISHFFESRAWNSTAKSPAGMFSTFEIPNDLASVIKIADEYELGNDSEGDESTPIVPPSVIVQVANKAVKAANNGNKKASELVKKPSSDELKQLAEDISGLSEKAQTVIHERLTQLETSVDKLDNEKYERVRLHVTQKSREEEVTRRTKILELTRLATQGTPKIPLTFLCKMVDKKAETFKELPSDAVKLLIDGWDRIVSSWKEHKPINKKQLKELQTVCAEHELLEEILLDHLQNNEMKLNIDTLADLPLKIYSTILGAIPNIVESMGANAESVAKNSASKFLPDEEEQEYAAATA